MERKKAEYKLTRAFACMFFKQGEAGIDGGQKNICVVRSFVQTYIAMTCSQLVES